MDEQDDFLPDWYSAPGDTIANILEEREMTEARFAERTGLSQGQVDCLLSGDEPITEEIAQKLSEVLGSTPGFWLRREAQYRAEKKRLTGV